MKKFTKKFMKSFMESFMKLSIALVLTGTLVLSACARTEPQSSTDPSDSDLREQTARTLPRIRIERISVPRYMEDGETLLMYYETDNITLEGEGYEKAAQTVREKYHTTEEELFAQTEDALEEAREFYDDMYDVDGWFAPYTSSATVAGVCRLDERVLSLRNLTSVYRGGAHDDTGVWGDVIDLESGQSLALEDLAEDAPGFFDCLTEYVLERLDGRKEDLFEDYAPYVRENIKKAGWYLDGEGIVIVYVPYEIGPYASGNIEVSVPYDEVAEYMKPEYLPGDGACILALRENCETKLSLADGEYTVRWLGRMSAEGSREIDFGVNGGESLVEPFVTVQHAYVMQKPDGRSFLLFDIDWMSSDFETFVYELKDGTAVRTEDIWAALDGRNIALDEMGMQFTLNVFGTYFTDMPCAFTEEGKLEPEKEIYEIRPDREWQKLTTVKELPVTVDGRQTALPAGTSLYINATDDAGTAWFTTAEPSGAEAVSGEIHYERNEEYTLLVNGVSEWEYFETIPYSG